MVITIIKIAGEKTKFILRIYYYYEIIVVKFR